MKRWKKTSQTRDPQIEQELLRDIRALLYILALRSAGPPTVDALNRLHTLEESRMDEVDE